MAATSMHNDALLDSEKCYKRKTDSADADVDTLLGSFGSTRSGEVAAEVSRSLGRNRRVKWRSAPHSVRNIDGNGET